MSQWQKNSHEALAWPVGFFMEQLPEGQHWTKEPMKGRATPFYKDYLSREDGLSRGPSDHRQAPAIAAAHCASPVSDMNGGPTAVFTCRNHQKTLNWKVRFNLRQYSSTMKKVGFILKVKLPLPGAFIHAAKITSQKHTKTLWPCLWTFSVQ